MSDSDFDLFWKAYPKKTAKERAKKAWKKLRGVSLTDVLCARCGPGGGDNEARRQRLRWIGMKGEGSDDEGRCTCTTAHADARVGVLGGEDLQG